MSKKGSKNDASNRNSRAALRRFNGQEVKPVMYDGSHAGHGRYMAAMNSDDKKLIIDAAGKPVRYAACQVG